MWTLEMSHQRVIFSLYKPIQKTEFPNVYSSLFLPAIKYVKFKKTFPNMMSVSRYSNYSY